jgi:hypothetical protein
MSTSESKTISQSAQTHTLTGDETCDESATIQLTNILVGQRRDNNNLLFTMPAKMFYAKSVELNVDKE